MATPQEVPDRKLATLASFFGTPVRPSHRALDDARATAVVLGELLGRLADRDGVMTLDDLDAWLAARDAEAAARHAAARDAADAAGRGIGPERWLGSAAAGAAPAACAARGAPTERPPGRAEVSAGDTVTAISASQRSGRQPVVTAIVLLKAEIHRIPEVAETIAQLPAVSEVYSITGDYDLVAIVRVRSHDELADVIPGGLNKVDGVTATQTHVAFRTYSRHDLEAAFSIGLADA